HAGIEMLAAFLEPGVLEVHQLSLQLDLLREELDGILQDEAIVVLPAGGIRFGHGLARDAETRVSPGRLSNSLLEPVASTRIAAGNGLALAAHLALAPTQIGRHGPGHGLDRGLRGWTPGAE